MKIKTTDEQLISAIEAVAAEDPYRVYQQDDEGRCFYLRDGAPSCLIGQALHRLGVSLSTLAREDAIQNSAENVIFKTLSGVSDRALSFASRVQTRQDLGHTWADAVSIAKEER